MSPAIDLARDTARAADAHGLVYWLQSERAFETQHDRCRTTRRVVEIEPVLTRTCR